MKRIVTAFALFILLSSHELFLRSDNYYYQTNTDAELSLYDGTFDASEEATDISKIYNSRVVGPNFDFEPSAGDFYNKNNFTHLKMKTSGAGTYVAGLAIQPEYIELSAADFNLYLQSEELIDIINHRESKGIADKPARERYSKYVKAIFQVGDDKSDHYKEEMGYPVEFVPQSNPYSTEVGGSITFKLLNEGQPIKNQLVHYSWRGTDGSKPLSERTLRSDDNGVFTLKIDQAGHWYLYTTHIVESDEADIDYRSKWGTITFAVK